ncbi:major facilitator superfamily protein [Halogeometricum pallidum JCM 14848]|uniref:Major facilitator superfamily protein n=1 Tax=Halogeometricum pallidum JCM 14848 TaxID=1227487 RepID=M0DAT7_HALPD|nr:MFS transporter [Halogeometricum pallidum]ELZ31299.1 major facilitator superfamily protein [Halogeometricum pallidum JCM 14848]
MRRRLGALDTLLLTAAIWFLAKFVRYAFPPLFPEFQATYGVSNGTIGLAYTAMMLVYAVMQFPSGVLADRVGSPRVIAGGVATAALGVFALSRPVSFPLLVGGMMLVGLGTGVHKTVAVRFLSSVYPERKGRALGVLDTFGALGGVVAPAAVVAVAGRYGWRTLFFASGVVALLLGGAFLVRTSSAEAADGGDDDASGNGGIDDDGASFDDYLALCADRRFGAFVLVTVAFSFTYNGVVAFLPLYLTTSTATNSTLANGLYSALFAVSFVQLLTGDLSDRVGSLRVIVGTLALALAGLVGLLVGSTTLALGASVVAFGLGSHGFRPVRGSFLVELVPDSLAGGGLGAVRTVLMGAGAVAPAVVGVVSERASFEAAFALLAASLLVAVAASAGLLATQ